MADTGSTRDLDRESAAGSGWTVDVARPVDRDSVVELRRLSMPRSEYFTFHDLARLDWNEDDERSSVIVVRDPQGVLQSTLRLSVFDAVADLERAVECSFEGIPVELPVLSLSRAATRPGSMSRGLMAWLRFYYLSVVRELPVRSVVGVVFEGAPRARSMESAGYAFFRPPRNWDSEVEAYVNVQVVLLASRDFDRAIEMTRRMIGPDSDRRFDFAGLHRALRTMLDSVCASGRGPAPPDP
ncbi:MAG: hypothetical protein M9951_10280 [Burkholderiaceae bacterium]|nr:hypothetical protein [Burkholderiaceae bacterium]